MKCAHQIKVKVCIHETLCSKHMHAYKGNLLFFNQILNNTTKGIFSQNRLLVQAFFFMCTKTYMYLHKYFLMSNRILAFLWANMSSQVWVFEEVQPTLACIATEAIILTCLYNLHSLTRHFYIVKVVLTCVHFFNFCSNT